MKVACILFCCALLTAFQSVQASSIAILDFELKDLTLAPNIPTEIQRTASIKGQVEHELQSAHYEIVQIPLDVQKQASAGEGYLMDHPEIAATLAAQAGADYILVGRLHKPSYLFAYIIGVLIRSKDASILGKYTVETKGGDKTLTLKAVENLSAKIDQSLDKRYQVPAPGSHH